MSRLAVGPWGAPFNAAKSVIVRVATGNTVELVPAPPTGHMTMLLWFRVINESTTATFEWSIQDTIGLLYAGRGASALAAAGVGAFPAAASNVLSPSFVTKLTRTAVTGTISGGGGGTPGVFILSYTYLPIADVVKDTFLALTTSYQAIDASCIPPTGRIAMPFPVMLTAGFAPFLGNTPASVMNDDTVTAVMQCRHTRAAVATVFTIQAAARGSSQFSLQYFPLEAGDQLEWKMSVAPGVAGAVTLRLWYTFAPLAA